MISKSTYRVSDLLLKLQAENLPWGRSPFTYRTQPTCQYSSFVCARRFKILFSEGLQLSRNSFIISSFRTRFLSGTSAFAGTAYASSVTAPSTKKIFASDRLRCICCARFFASCRRHKLDAREGETSQQYSIDRVSP